MREFGILILDGSFIQIRLPAAMHNKNNGTLRPKTTSPGSNTVMNMNAYKLGINMRSLTLKVITLIYSH